MGFDVLGGLFVMEVLKVIGIIMIFLLLACSVQAGTLSNILSGLETVGFTRGEAIAWTGTVLTGMAKLAPSLGYGALAGALSGYITIKGAQLVDALNEWRTLKRVPVAMWLRSPGVSEHLIGYLRLGESDWSQILVRVNVAYTGGAYYPGAAIYVYRKMNQNGTIVDGVSFYRSISAGGSSTFSQAKAKALQFLAQCWNAYYAAGGFTSEEFSIVESAYNSAMNAALGANTSFSWEDKKVRTIVADTLGAIKPVDENYLYYVPDYMPTSVDNTPFESYITADDYDGFMSTFGTVTGGYASEGVLVDDVYDSAQGLMERWADIQYKLGQVTDAVNALVNAWNSGASVIADQLVDQLVELVPDVIGDALETGSASIVNYVNTSIADARDVISGKIDELSAGIDSDIDDLNSQLSALNEALDTLNVDVDMSGVESRLDTLIGIESESKDILSDIHNVDEEAGGFWGRVLEFLKRIVVPREGYWDDWVNDLNDEMYGRIPFGVSEWISDSLSITSEEGVGSLTVLNANVDLFSNSLAELWSFVKELIRVIVWVTCIITCVIVLKPHLSID